MADIDSIKRIYRRLAKIKAGDDLQLQIKWLMETFVAHAEHADADSQRVTVANYKTSNSSFAFPDSTPHERAEALDRLITEMEAEIAGAAAVMRPGFLVPQFDTYPIR